MADPAIAHLEAIHITAANNTALSSSNKIEETSSFNLSRAATTVDRQNLNSSNGHTLVSVTWQALTGSMSGRVVRGSTVQEDMQTAAKTGAVRYLHVITDSSTTTPGDKTGEYYAIVFESYEETHEAGALVEFSASFKVSGAATDIVVPTP
jgi:hypothetical protein